MLEAVDSAPESPSKHPSASSILVVDDENASGELVAALLRSQGYSVRLACDGREACSLIARGGVDLLLLDLMMSRMDGVEVCSYVRNQLCDSFLPIVITTSLTDRESRIRAKEAGADDVLVKPLDGLELLVRIESLLRTRAQLGQLMRERDRAVQELSYARSILQVQQRTLRTLEAAGEGLRSVVDRQWRLLESVRKRWSGVGEAREDLARLGQLSSELSQGVDQLAGAATGTIVRASSVTESVDGADDRPEERAPSATAIK
ncbi:MAG: CheY-like response regulator receiver [Myxococcaceae bacterium]|nr:CheY-like response regulator receiver [Myxococcaceae bacterium]